MKLTDIDDNQARFCLFKGEPKTGKSPAAASVAIYGPTYLFDLDQRVKSIQHYYKSICTKHYDAVMQNLSFDWFDSYIAVKNKLESLKQQCPYKYIIVDSLTAFARMSLKTMLETRRPSTKVSGGKIETKDRGGILLSALEDYGGESSAINHLIDSLLVIRKLWNTTIVLIAHVINPEAGAYCPQRVLLTGGKKIAGELPIHFGEAYHFFVETEGGMEMGSSSNRRYVVFTRSVGNDWANTDLILDAKIDVTNKALWEEIENIVRLPNDNLITA